MTTGDLLGRALAIGALVVGAAGCKHRHVPVGAVPELGYPACAGTASSGAAPRPMPAAPPRGFVSIDEPIVDAGASAADPGALVAAGHIRSGPLSVEQLVDERFELRRTACGYRYRTRQEWPLAVSDVEVRYDADLRPIWAWKRMTIPGSTRADGNADIHRYELRTGDVFIVHRDDHARTTMEKLLPGGKMPVASEMKVGAVVGPGRGILTPWLWRARLPVGGKTHDLVLDFRAGVETLEMAALERDADRFEPSLGRNVRVYTFYGREAVFADEHDVVVGDLAGMRPSDSLSTPRPPPLPEYGAPDPVHTP